MITSLSDLLLRYALSQAGYRQFETKPRNFGFKLAKEASLQRLEQQIAHLEVKHGATVHS